MITTLINGFIGGIIGGIVNVKISEMIFERKTKTSYLKIITILIFASILAMNYLVVDNFLKVIIIFMDNIMLNIVVFKERLDKTIVVSFIEYINILISEIIVVMVLMLIFELFTNSSIEIIKNTLLSNVLILSVNYWSAKLMINKYKKIIEKINNNRVMLLAMLAALILVCIGSLFYKIDSISWQLNNSVLLNAIIIIITAYIGITTIIQRLNYEKIDRQYKDLAKYSEINSTLLEEYSMLNHEYKNQLIIIEGMIENNEPEVREYIKSLITKKSQIKFKWIKELNNISFQGLKSFMNYKILEMVNEKIKVDVTISKECKDYQLGKMSTSDKDKIYSIIGVFLDNAKEASKESEEKEVVITAYVDETAMYIEIANTFEGKINLDKIKNYGYTSKGTGHGTGYI